MEPRRESPTATELRDFLADRDAPCPSCTYNLRGLSGPACPECGRALVLEELLPKEPSAKAQGDNDWIAVVIEAVLYCLMFWDG